MDGIFLHCNPSLRRGGMNSLLRELPAQANSTLNQVASCGVPMRTLHQRGLDKRQTPYSGEPEDAFSRFLENFPEFLCRSFESIHGPRGCLIRGGVGRSSAPWVEN